MKFLILLLSMSYFLLAGDFFSTSKTINNYKQVDKAYDESEITTMNNCNTCGVPAVLLPYNGENIPIAKTFPCTPIKGCISTVLFKPKKETSINTSLPRLL